MKNIKINGDLVKLDEEMKTISYEDIVKLANLKTTVLYTCVYKAKVPAKVGEENVQADLRGILIPGQSVPVVENMHIDIVYTGNA